MKKIKIGFIIADIDEFNTIDLKSYGLKIKDFDYHGMKCYKCEFEKNGKYFEYFIVLSGVGLICAANAATCLCLDNVDLILNAGLSGSISKLKKNDVLVCDRYYEHDSDFSSLGYEYGKIPGIPLYFESDKKLVDFFLKNLPDSTSGTAVSGNQFIASKDKKDFLKNTFDAKSCDMESFAIALVCNRENIPFVSIRKVSDSAMDVEEYRAFEENETSSLFDDVFKVSFNLGDIF